MNIQIKSFDKSDGSWLDLRKKFITGTELSCIFGLNKYMNVRQMMERKIVPQFVENVYTIMGKILEPAVLNSYGALMETDNIALFSDSGKQNIIYFDEDIKLSATPDAFVGSSIDNILFPVELKSTSPLNISKWRQPESFPFNYFLQLYAQCILLERDKGHLSGMAPVYPNLPAITIELNMVSDIRDLIISELYRFWEDWDNQEDFTVSSSAKVKMVSLMKLNSRVLATRGVTAPPSYNETLTWDPL